MYRIKAAIRQRWFWACQNKPFWIHLLLGVVTVAFLVIPPATTNGTSTDLPVRFWGMCLQLIGAYTVWIDLTGTAKGFGTQPLNTFDWLKSFFRPHPPITGSGTAMLEGVEASTGVGTVTATGSQPSIEERVAILEKQAIGLVDQLAVVRHELRTQKDAITDSLQKLEAELCQQIRNMQDQIKDAFIGNYKTLRVGAIWLVVGIVLSSVAVEITNFIHVCQLPKFW